MSKKEDKNKRIERIVQLQRKEDLEKQGYIVELFGGNDSTKPDMKATKNEESFFEDVKMPLSQACQFVYNDEKLSENQIKVKEYFQKISIASKGITYQGEVDKYELLEEMLNKKSIKNIIIGEENGIIDVIEVNYANLKEKLDVKIVCRKKRSGSRDVPTKDLADLDYSKQRVLKTTKKHIYYESDKTGNVYMYDGFKYKKQSKTNNETIIFNLKYRG